MANTKQCRGTMPVLGKVKPCDGLAPKSSDYCMICRPYYEGGPRVCYFQHDHAPDDWSFDDCQAEGIRIMARKYLGSSQ